MKYEDICDMWDNDSNVDMSNLGKSTVYCAKLHSKYLRLLLKEKKELRQLEASMKILKLEKTEFLLQGPSKETQEKGWVLPPKGKIVKIELPLYLEADSDMIKLSLNIGSCQEKIYALESILKTINSMGYNINAAIEYQKFMNGG
jgi:hypothetical protein